MKASEIVRDRYICRYCENKKWPERKNYNVNIQNALAAHMKHCPMQPSFSNITSSHSSIRHADNIGSISKRRKGREQGDCHRESDGNYDSNDGNYDHGNNVDDAHGDNITQQEPDDFSGDDGDDEHEEFIPDEVLVKSLTERRNTRSSIKKATSSSSSSSSSSSMNERMDEVDPLSMLPSSSSSSSSLSSSDTRTDEDKKANFKRNSPCELAYEHQLKLLNEYIYREPKFNPRSRKRSEMNGLLAKAKLDSCDYVELASWNESIGLLGRDQGNGLLTTLNGILKHHNIENIRFPDDWRNLIQTVTEGSETLHEVFAEAIPLSPEEWGTEIAPGVPFKPPVGVHWDPIKKIAERLFYI
jgi:hypothetical protein